MVQLIQNAKDLEDDNNMEVHAVSEQLPIPFMETERKSGETGADLFQKLESPRFMQTHLPYELWKTALEKHPDMKIIRTIRNPKDTLVSYFHHIRNDEIMGGFNGTWNQFFQLYKEKKLPYGDFFQINAEWLKFFLNRSNVLVLIYEEMKKDHRAHVLKIAQFLGQEISPKVTDVIVQKTTFENMSKEVNPVVKTYETWKKEGDFVRKGEVGDWLNYFSEEQSKYVDDKCQEYLEPLGIKFQYT